jgi:hypothetical protein
MGRNFNKWCERARTADAGLKIDDFSPLQPLGDDHYGFGDWPVTLLVYTGIFGTAFLLGFVLSFFV